MRPATQPRRARTGPIGLQRPSDARVWLTLLVILVQVLMPVAHLHHDALSADLSRLDTGAAPVAAASSPGVPSAGDSSCVLCDLIHHRGHWVVDTPAALDPLVACAGRTEPPIGRAPENRSTDGRPPARAPPRSSC